MFAGPLLEISVQPQPELPPALAAIDVLLVLGTPPPEAWWRGPRNGAWAFDHDHTVGAPPFFWTLRRAEPLSTVRLVRLGSGPPQTLAQGTVPTALRSYARQLDAGRSLAPALLEQACRRLHMRSTPAETTQATPDPLPRPLDCLALWVRTGAARLSNALSLLFRHDQWAIGVVSQPIHRLIESGRPGPTHWITGGRRACFLADPFALRTSDGGLSILAESYDYGEGVGRIAAMTVTSHGISPIQTVLSQPFHLSYPFLLEHGGERFCLPEAAASGQVRLWRARDFPRHWEPGPILLDHVHALDGTTVFHGGRWWLFAAIKEGPAGLSLHAWHSDSLFGPWIPHALNPLKVDAGSTRPAGTLFERQGVLYRPAQDGSAQYGGAVVICRIDRLSPTEFQETVVGAVRPDPDSPYPAGLHTVCAAGDQTVIDAKRRIFIPAAFFAQCRQWSRRALRLPEPGTPAGLAP